MRVEIDTIADYKVYLTKQIDKLYPKANKKAKEAVIAMLLNAFNDGMALRGGLLEVTV